MRRRDLIALAGAAAFVPVRVFAADPFVIGYLGVASGREYPPYLQAFRQALADNGFAEGQKLRIEYRWADGRYEKLPELATDLVSQKVHLIVTSGGNASALAAKHATQTIPIVFVTGGDPVGNGVVSSLARPSGNVTEINMLTYELGAKRLQLLSEMLPDAKVIGFLTNPNNPGLQHHKQVLNEIDEAARARGLTAPTMKASTAAEIDGAFAQLSTVRIDGLVLDSDAFFNSRREQILALAARYGVPGIYEWREFTGAGGLMSYGTNLTSVFRLAAIYCTKIPGGAEPADLPVQQPTEFELVINLRRAKVLGITAPQMLLARADEVIE